jgi:hypothetical protein
MKYIKNSSQINRELMRCVEKVGQLSMEAVVGIDRLAARCTNPSDLVFFNELASSLELMQSQIDYYVPTGEGAIDLNEWADALAVLNSGADFIEDQALELEMRCDESLLGDCLQELSLSYIEAIPFLIAARLAHEEPEPIAEQRIPQLVTDVQLATR